MKPFKDYDKTQAYTEYKRLPKGGYQMTVLNACEKRWPKTGDLYIEIACDISEGKYAGFFAERYKKDTREDKKWGCNFNLNEPNDEIDWDNKEEVERLEWQKRKFKTVTNAFEDSNPGYHWDWNEAALKGKKIGGLFNIRQWEKNDGSVGETTNLAQLIDVNKIATGDYELPKDKLLEPRQDSMDDLAANNPFAGLDDSLPFN